MLPLLKTEKRRNLLIIGGTGNGKSSTCCTLSESEEFEISFDSNSKTKECKFLDIDHLNIRIIDTPGFGDTSLTEKEIKEILTSQARMIIFDDDSNSSTNQIDAILLINMVDPRISASLKPDLKNLIMMYGEQALKSVIVLCINPNKNINPEVFIKDIREEVNKHHELLSNLQPDAFIYWDNFNPNKQQLNELFSKISEVSPYSNDNYFIEILKLKCEKIDKIEEAMKSKLDMLKRLKTKRDSQSTATYLDESYRNWIQPGMAKTFQLADKIQKF